MQTGHTAALAKAARLAGIAVTRHKQVNDICLLGLTAKREGRLVTFDRALAMAGLHGLVPGQ